MKYIFYTAVLLLVGCTDSTPPKSNPLNTLMESQHMAILPIKQKLPTHELQIMYTEIERTDGTVKFIDHHFQENETDYFYPASSVKLPVAALALEYLNNHEEIGAGTTYVTDRDSITHTIAEDIRRIFAVSSNQAYNRLYELLGRDYINKKLKEKGLNARIAHRLETENPANPNRTGLDFIVAADTINLGRGKDAPIEPLTLNKIKKGKGYLKNGELIESPMDFSEKNYLPVSTQHEIIKRLFFPENYKKEETFQLSEVNRALLLKEMHIVPRLNGFQEWEVWDSFGKFFIFGDSKSRLPGSFKYYNKVGYAYGTLNDTAYIVDTQNEIEFIVTATLLVNENEIFNDDTYEYGTLGIPFFGEIGRAIYQLELDKVRKKNDEK